MTHLTAGPVTIITNERFKRIPLDSAARAEAEQSASETQGWSGFRPVPGNQATYLFFPNFTSMLLVILSTVSTPLIKGMSVVNVKLVESEGMSGGHIKLGAWGWCLSGLNDFPDQCSARRSLGGTLQYLTEVLPKSLKPLHNIGEAVPKPYLAASDAIDIMSCIAAWWLINTTLAASGAWSSQWQKAYRWTKIAYWSTFVGTMFNAVSFGLEVNKYVVMSKFIKSAYETQPKVSMGPVIFLKLAALVIGLGCCGARLFMLQFKPRPIWTMKGRSQDFVAPQPSAALYPSDEQPPTCLNLGDEKAPLDHQGIQEISTPDFTTSDRGTMI